MTEGRLKGPRARQFVLNNEAHTMTRDEKEMYSVKLGTGGTQQSHSKLHNFIFKDQKYQNKKYNVNQVYLLLM